jgi:hypothetical protein
VRPSTWGETWRPAVAVAATEGAVIHALRHYYASLLMRRRESIKTLRERLSCASAVETLDTCSHL